MPARLALHLPRLTSSLRDPFDVDSAYLRRKTILQNLLSHSARSSTVESELARKIVRNWEEASPQVRQAYKLFVGAVVDLIDGDVASDVFREVAFTAYRLFGIREDDYKGKIADKKFELQKLLGYSVSDAYLQKVATYAKQLLDLQPANCVTAGASDSNDDGAIGETEFGADLDFQLPSRFVVDFGYESELFSGDEIMVPSTSSSNAWQASNNMDSHIALSGINYDLKWLRGVCDQIVSFSVSQLSRDELAMTICRVLDSDKPGEEIASDLLDLVGDSSFETVQELISHRKELVDAIHHGLLVLRSDKTPLNTQPRMPSYGTQVTVVTETEKQIDKLRRKEERRQKRGMDYGAEDDFSAASFTSLLEASERKNLFDDLIGSGEVVQSIPASALPQGTVRKHFKGYEEVIIPPTPTAPLKPGEKLGKLERERCEDPLEACFPCHPLGCLVREEQPDLL